MWCKANLNIKIDTVKTFRMYFRDKKINTNANPLSQALWSALPLLKHRKSNAMERQNFIIKKKNDFVEEKSYQF